MNFNNQFKKLFFICMTIIASNIFADAEIPFQAPHTLSDTLIRYSIRKLYALNAQEREAFLNTMNTNIQESLLQTLATVRTVAINPTESAFDNLMAYYNTYGKQ